jgi:hypothetical protein
MPVKIGGRCVEGSPERPAGQSSENRVQLLAEKRDLHPQWAEEEPLTRKPWSGIRR